MYNPHTHTHTHTHETSFLLLAFCPPTPCDMSIMPFVCRAQSVLRWPRVWKSRSPVLHHANPMWDDGCAPLHTVMEQRSRGRHASTTDLLSSNKASSHPSSALESQCIEVRLSTCFSRASDPQTCSVDHSESPENRARSRKPMESPPCKQRAYILHTPYPVVHSPTPHNLTFAEFRKSTSITPVILKILLLNSTCSPLSAIASGRNWISKKSYMLR